MDIKTIWTKTPSFVKWALLAILLIGGSFAAGRYSAPEKVKVEIVEREKIVEKEKIVEVVKWKTKTVKKTEFVRDQTIVADANTKCDETFDRETGKLTHRLCERVTHTDTSVSERRISELTLLSETLKNKVTEQETTIEKLKSTKTETTYATKPNWHLGAMALVEPSTTINLNTIQYGVTVERRIVWDLYGGVTAIPQAGLYGLSLSLNF
jgi:uncharacterized protein YbcC (UPF0753/DUF2309 family)